MIIVFVISWLLGLTTFLAGYALGRGMVTVQTYQSIKKELAHKILPQYRQPSGIIQRPSAQRLNELHHPAILEEKEEMKKALEKGIEPLTL